jgi:hypothetical protein
LVWARLYSLAKRNEIILFPMKVNNEWKKTAAIITSVIGVLSSVISLFTTSLSNMNISLGIGIILLTIIAVLVIVYIIPKDNLSEGTDAIMEEIVKSNSPNSKKVVFPCDARYYKAANKLAKEKFGKNSVSTRTVDDWKKKNEFILTCLTDKNKMVGYFDILPLKTDFAIRLINGEVGEKEIGGAHILAPNEMQNAEYLYFAGMAVQDTEKGCLDGAYLACAAIIYTRLFYQNSPIKKILTIPTSECGLRMAEHLGFSLEREGKLRKDGFDIYSYIPNTDNISDVIINEKNMFGRFDSSAYIVGYKKMKERFSIASNNN